MNTWLTSVVESITGKIKGHPYYTVAKDKISDLIYHTTEYGKYVRFHSILWWRVLTGKNPYTGLSDATVKKWAKDKNNPLSRIFGRKPKRESFKHIKLEEEEIPECELEKNYTDIKLPSGSIGENGRTTRYYKDGQIIKEVKSR
jgi:hypothetical protein